MRLQTGYNLISPTTWFCSNNDEPSATKKKKKKKKKKNLEIYIFFLREKKKRWECFLVIGNSVNRFEIVKMNELESYNNNKWIYCM